MIKLKLFLNRIKKTFQSRENILAVYSPRIYIIPEADTVTIDTEIIINLPQNSKVYLTTKFKGQKIKEIRGPQKKRLRITLLNESYFQKHIIKKGDIVGYLLSPNSNFFIQQQQKKSIKYRQTTSRKRGTGKISGKKRRKQTGGFFSRYDFAYAGRDTVNQVGKIAPNIIKNATNNINKIAKKRIDQVIKTGGKEIERIAPKNNTWCNRRSI